VFLVLLIVCRGKTKENYKNNRLIRNKFIYLIKIQGKTKIPDYIQMRDENYTLLAYFRADRPEKALVKCGFETHINQFKEIINALPFGKMHKIEI
jgi:hypothetical protein